MEQYTTVAVCFACEISSVNSRPSHASGDLWKNTHVRMGWVFVHLCMCACHNRVIPIATHCFSNST